MHRAVLVSIALAACAPHVASPHAARAVAPAPRRAGTGTRASAPPAPAPAPDAPSAGSPLWIVHFGGNGSAQGSGVAVAPDGTVLVCGQFSQDLTIGSTRFVSAGNEDVFVAALAPDGTPRWARVFGGAGHDDADGVAVDASGNIYLTGFFTDAMNVGDTTLRAAGVHDIFLIKLAADGTPLWSRRYGDAADQVSLRVFPDASGRLIAAGYARGTVRFGKRALSSYPDKATFFARLDADGNALWSMGFGHIYDYAYPAAVTNAAGHVFFSAGSDPPGAHKPRQTDLGLVLGETDDAGKLIWKKRIGGESANMDTSIALEPTGDIVTAGSFGGALDFGDESGELRAMSMSDAFVARLDAKGGPMWSQRFGGTQLQNIAGLAVAPDGGIHVAGQFSQGNLRLGAFVLAGTGTENGFIAHLAPNGPVASATCLCADRLAWLSGIALDPSGSVVVSGALAGTLALGAAQVTSSGPEDAIFAKLPQ